MSWNSFIRVLKHHAIGNAAEVIGLGEIVFTTYLPTLQIFDYFSDFDIVEDYIDILESLNDELV